MTFQVKIEVDGDVHEISFEHDDGWTATIGDTTWPVEMDEDIVNVGGVRIPIGAHTRDTILLDGQATPFSILELHGLAGADEAGAGGHGPIHAPMTGRLEELLVEPGQEVAAGDVLFVLEAMKMRNQIKAQAAGTVEAIHVAPGATVDPKTVILELAP